MIEPKILHWNDEHTTACGWLVVDRLIHGVCGGGTFMHPSASLKETSELAQTMSYKNALQKIPFGGAKAGIRYDHLQSDAHDVLKRFLHFLKPELNSIWCTGSDLNTTNHVMHALIRDMGLTSMFDSLGQMIAGKLKIENQSAAIFSRMSRMMTPYFSLSEGATGYSVSQVIASLFDGIPPRLFIQGFGSVGRSLACFVHTLNLGKVVGICDIDGIIYHKNGIDTIELLNNYFSSPAGTRESMRTWLSVELKKKYNFQHRDMRESDEEYFSRALSFTDIDVLSPCAHRYSITQGILNSISARHQRVAIIAGANNVFDSPEVKSKALSLGIKYIPEWVSNCGNAILYEELLGIEKMPHNYTAYFQHAIRTNIRSFMNDSQLEGISIRHWDEAFIQTAERRISRANARSYATSHN